MKISKFIIIIMLLVFLPTTVSLAQAGIDFSCQMPYFLGKAKSSVVAGERINLFFTIENTGIQAQQLPVKITFPPGLLPIGNYEGWMVKQVGELYSLEREVSLAGGYSQWFDLVTVQSKGDLPEGMYLVQVQGGNETKQIVVPILAPGDRVKHPLITIQDVILPVDKEGKKDERQTEGALVLRDPSLDYYKNMINGKGTSNLEVEAIHPITHMVVEIDNPMGEEKLVVLTTRLLNPTTHQPIAGLFTPGTTGEDKGAGSVEGHDDSLVAFVGLTGEKKQRILLPIYAEEKSIMGGNYLLEVRMTDEFSAPISKEVPFVLVKKDWKAMGVVGMAVTVLAIALVVAGRRLPSLLRRLKTRWLVTIALFGTVTFGVVTVPSTLLSDFFHILLGPFSILVTGLFSSVCLYMLIISLVVLIPQPGVVTLMALVRMMLGMIAFGHISPLSVLSYGMHALMLEGLLYGLGMFEKIKNSKGELTLGNGLLLAGICATGDSVATYVSMESMSFLYRFYYADWYIYMLIIVNSCIYTGIGAKCGVFLGSKLGKVGGD